MKKISSKLNEHSSVTDNYTMEIDKLGERERPECQLNIDKDNNIGGTLV